jgi:hypothetical protein
MKKELEQTLEDFFFGEVENPVKGDYIFQAMAHSAPSGYWKRCAMGAVQTLDEKVKKYIAGTKTKEDLIDDMKLCKLTPILMAEVIEWADNEKKGE